VKGHRVVLGNLCVDPPFDGEDLLVEGVH
jgi:hypothetical protein